MLLIRGLGRAAVALALLAAGCSRSGDDQEAAAQATQRSRVAAHRTSLLERLESDPHFFPIGVWLQSPLRLDQYRAIGVNVFVGFNGDVTAADLANFRRAKTYAFAVRKSAFPESYSGHALLGWLSPDEPDNAQRREDGSFGSCVLAALLRERYAHTKGQDGRPIMLNFGRGVADPQWKGRGRCAAPDTYYPEAAQAADLVAFDIYPVAQYGGRLELVARGVRNLKRWSARSDPRRPVWNFIEASPLLGGAIPSAAQLRSQVWLSIINGSRGIVYFPWRVDSRGQAIREDELFAHPALVRAIQVLNREIRTLAPILKQGKPLSGMSVASQSGAPISATALDLRGRKYLLLASESARPEQIRISADWIRRGERRAVTSDAGLPTPVGGFEERLEGYGVRLYQLSGS